MMNERLLKRNKFIIILIALIVTITSTNILSVNAVQSMSTSQVGIDYIKGFEGFRGTAYKALPSETYYTIGYGHYGSDVYAGMTITQEQAENLLRTDLVKYEGYVNTFLNKNNITVTQNQFDALTSFTYNLGNVWVSYDTFQLKTYLINGISKYTDSQITTAFTNWNKANGVAISGLTKRRQKEAELFLSGDNPIPPSVDDFKQDTNYPTPITAYPHITSGKVTLYNASLNAYDTNTRYISYNDQCTINELYTNGYCKVTYPTSQGSNTAYAKISDFIPNPVEHYSFTAADKINTFKRSDLSESFGHVDVGDNCIVVGKSGNNEQLIYPVPGGYKLGWIDPADTPVVPDDERDDVIIPGPIASGAFNEKKVVAVAPKKISFSENEYISQGDICILYDVDPSTGYCTVDYPSGSNDVFTASKVKTKTVAINEFINYNGSAQAETAQIPNQLTAYPTSEMNNTVGSYTANWYLDPGDTYTTINQINGATEVLYYCSQGKHAGYWKLAWVWLDYYTLDVNGYLDNQDTGSLENYGTVDVYINGTLRAGDVNDFYGISYPKGSTYEIKDIRPYTGYTYNGVHSGATSGTLTGNTDVRLNFTKNAVTCTGIMVTKNPDKLEYLEGESLDRTGLEISANFSDGTNKIVTNSCQITGYSSTPGMKTVVVTYDGKSTAFTVNVKSKSPTGITIDKGLSKTEYYVGETVDFSEMIVKVTYDNGTVAVVDNYDIYTGGEVTETAGRKKVELLYTYNDVTISTSFTVDVLNKTSDENVPQFMVESTKIQAGREVEVAVIMKNNPGIVATKISISYNTDILTLEDVKDGGLIGVNSMVKGNDMTAVPYNITWEDSLASSNYTTDGIIAVLTFKVNENAPLGTTPINITLDQGSTFDVNIKEVVFGTIGGTIEIIDRMPGDANEDGLIDLKDVTIIKRHVAGGWNVTVHESNADVNQDNVVDLKDVVILKRYIAGGWGVELK